MPKGGRHGNLSPRASRVYEALRNKRGMPKERAAKIANAVTHGGVAPRRGRRR
jgi:hypothetical protein